MFFRVAKFCLSGLPDLRRGWVNFFKTPIYIIYGVQKWIPNNQFWWWSIFDLWHPLVLCVWQFCYVTHMVQGGLTGHKVVTMKTNCRMINFGYWFVKNMNLKILLIFRDVRKKIIPKSLIMATLYIRISKMLRVR